MNTLLSQIRAAMTARLYYVALQSALTVPDIAGALCSSDRKATGERYSTWFDTWIRPVLREKRSRENPFTGQQCYVFRCSMLHQGASHRGDSAYKRIMFIEPGHPAFQMHYVKIGADTQTQALLIQLDEFVDEMVVGCEAWLREAAGTQPFEKNYDLFARRHPDGLRPWVVGVPVIG